MLNLKSTTQTIIIYVLASILAVAITSHTWTWIKLNTAKDSIVAYEANEATLKADVERAVRAEKSCKENVKQLIEDANKKSVVVKKYIAKLKEGALHERITSLDEFINYTKRLYR